MSRLPRIAAVLWVAIALAASIDDVRAAGDPSPVRVVDCALPSPVPTQLEVSTDPNPSHCGSKVTVTAHIEPPTASGEVSFFKGDGGGPLGTATLVNGVATLSIVATLETLGPGAYTIGASYAGDRCHWGTSGASFHDVERGATTTTLALDPNPAPCGGKVTLTARVDGFEVGGFVEFFDGDASLERAAVDEHGVASLSFTPTTAGTHALTALYQGDPCRAGSTSQAVDLVVEGSAVRVALFSDPQPSMCGQKVTLSAAVDFDGPGGYPPGPSGQVNFFDDGTPIGSAAIVNGVATLSITMVGVGPRSFTAVYKGDACYDANTSEKLHHFVAHGGSTVGLTSSPNPSNCDQKITLTAPVDPPTATGTVSFYDGLSYVGSEPLVNGTATLSIPTPDHGPHSFIAFFEGDTCVGPAASDTVAHSHDCTTPTLLLLFRAEPLAGAVELRWQFGEASHDTGVRLERGTNEAGPWMPVIPETHVSGGIAVAVDRSVEPGRSYWYRLVARTASGTMLAFGPIAVTTSSAITRFELGAARPNPSRGDTRIDFAVARESNIRLSIVDIQGREVAVLAQGPHGAGRHQTVWMGQTARGPAAVGLYFIRYQYPGSVQIGRLVLTR